jgi:hypothetical protein
LDGESCGGEVIIYYLKLQWLLSDAKSSLIWYLGKGLSMTRNAAKFIRWKSTLLPLEKATE